MAPIEAHRGARSSTPRLGDPVDKGALCAIYERHAVRAYTEQPVPEEDIQALLDAAVHAPSAVNVQPWAFVVVQQAELLTRYSREAKALLLAEPPVPEVVSSGLPELDRLRQLASEPGTDLVHGAAALIVIYATSSGGVPDCFLAAENLMLAAWAFDLGTCPIGLAGPLFNRAEVKEELGVPSEWVVALPIVVGHPAEHPRPTARRSPHVISWS